MNNLLLFSYITLTLTGDEYTLTDDGYLVTATNV